MRFSLGVKGMYHDFDRDFFDVRVITPEQTTGDDTVTFLDEATPCGCTFFDWFACVWVDE